MQLDKINWVSRHHRLVSECPVTRSLLAMLQAIAFLASFLHVLQRDKPKLPSPLLLEALSVAPVAPILLRDGSRRGLFRRYTFQVDIQEFDVGIRSSNSVIAFSEAMSFIREHHIFNRDLVGLYRRDQFVTFNL